MTGYEKMAAAFSSAGAPEIPAVVCYPSLLLRDFWRDATDAPWWSLHETAPDRAAQPRMDIARRTDMDWFQSYPGFSLEDQANLFIETLPDGVFRVDRRTGERIALHPPLKSGGPDYMRNRPQPPAEGVTDPDVIEALVEERLLGKGRSTLADDGRLDLPRTLRAALGSDKMALTHYPAPFWVVERLWSFESAMRGVYDFPELFDRAIARYVRDEVASIAAYGTLGPAAIWIEDCISDMLSPEAFRRFNIEPLRRITEAIRAAGMYSIHYFTGNPHGKWDLLLESGRGRPGPGGEPEGIHGGHRRSGRARARPHDALRKPGRLRHARARLRRGAGSGGPAPDPSGPRQQQSVRHERRQPRDAGHALQPRAAVHGSGP